MKNTVLTAVTALLLAAPAFAQTAPATTPATPAPANAPATPATPAPASTGSKAHVKSAATPVPSSPVNVNTATAAQLTTIPGISAKIAADVIKNRPYKTSADLVKKVSGIGPRNIKKMLSYITF